MKTKPKRTSILIIGFLIIMLLVMAGSILATPEQQDGDVIIPGPDPYPYPTFDVIEIPDTPFRIYDHERHFTIIINDQ
jgi:hypothetical protein